MNARLAALLRQLADTLDPAREQEIARRHQAALTYEPVERLPLVVSYPLPPDDPWQPFPHHEIFDDPEKMLFNELVSAWDTHLVYRPLVGDDLPATIRANFGTVLVASAFGARVEQVEDNPPWVRPFASRAALAAALARGPVDLSAGWLPRVVERYRFYREVLALYPPLPDVIRLVLPDLQGPVDTLEMLCGSALYADLIDDPAFVAQALDTRGRRADRPGPATRAADQRRPGRVQPPARVHDSRADPVARRFGDHGVATHVPPADRTARRARAGGAGRRGHP